MNWTQLTCEGLPALIEGRPSLFEGRPCENYSNPPPQCSLLKERAITRLCETGRCIFAMMGFVQEKLAERFDHLDDREDIDLEQLRDRLRRVVWTGSSTPVGWLMYVKTAVQRATVRALAKQRLMPEEKNCGTCLQLTKSNPRVCQISGDRKKVTDRACDHYHFLSIIIGAESGDGFGDLGEEREANFSPAAIERSDEAQRGVDARMDVESLRLELAKRVEKAKQGTRQRAIFARQYELFLNLHHLAGEVESDKDALRIVSRQMGVSQKMVRRDLAEIREFLSSRFQ
jgi:hypothetical protein